MQPQLRLRSTAVLSPTDFGRGTALRLQGRATSDNPGSGMQSPRRASGHQRLRGRCESGARSRRRTRCLSAALSLRHPRARVQGPDRQPLRRRSDGRMSRFQQLLGEVLDSPTHIQEAFTYLRLAEPDRTTCLGITTRSQNVAVDHGASFQERGAHHSGLSELGVVSSALFRGRRNPNSREADFEILRLHTALVGKRILNGL